MQILEYQFAQGSRFSAGADGEQAQVVGNCLEGLRQEAGFITASMVVREAKKKRSPLHQYFQWDDTQAAKQFRLEQARLLIRCVVAVYDRVDQPEPIRAYVRVHEGYQDTAQTLADVDSREIVLAKAKADAASFKRKYKDLVELADVISAIDKL